MNQKNDDQNEPQPHFLFRGETINAEYIYQIVEEFRGNPLIEALPEILSPEDAARALVYSPDYKPSDRALPLQYRLLKIENAREFFLPLSRDIELYYTVMNMIRRGYLNRNPITTEYYTGINNRIEKLDDELNKHSQFKRNRSKARGATIVGTGGNGKSSSIENNLLLLPQVIIHESYNGSDLILKQLVWLKLNCPQDGSIRGLCLAFFSAVDDVLGTSYLKQYNNRRNTINDLLLYMARVAAIHCLGTLVIDEIQDLSQAKSGGAEHLLNFFVHLENSIGVPFILIGTPKAVPLFKGEFRQARRASEQGDYLWKRLKMISKKQLPGKDKQPDPEWDNFVRQMWRYQYVENFTPLPGNILDEPVTVLIYNESQGIIAVALTIFMLSQKRAILSGVERLTTNIVKSAIRDNQNLIRDMIDSIKLGRKISIQGEYDFEPSIFRTHLSTDISPKNNNSNSDQQDANSDQTGSNDSVSDGVDTANNVAESSSISGNKSDESSSVTKPNKVKPNELLCLVHIADYVKSPMEFYQ